MGIDQQLIDNYIKEHSNRYTGKYRYYASYQNGDYSYKCHYYMLDKTFMRIDIYVDITYKDEIKYHFSEELLNYEQEYIIKDILQRLSTRLSYPSMLHYSLYEGFTKNASYNEFQLNPIDYYNILEYMNYHDKISQQTIDKFYDIFIKCLDNYLHQKHYKKYLQSVILILKNILYEYSFEGMDAKYLDTQYQYHVYFIRKIIRTVYNNLDRFDEQAPSELIEAIELMCKNTRFAFMIMTDFGNLVLSHYSLTKKLIKNLKKKFILNDKDNDTPNANLVFSYIYYIFINDYQQYKAVLLKVLRMVITNMLTYANSDLDLALGNTIIKVEGYEILLELFHEDYNTIIFTCFPISSFPRKLIPKVRRELEGAVKFFGARMENDKYRLSSFEQVQNINRLLLDNFGGWYK